MKNKPVKVDVGEILRLAGHYTLAGTSWHHHLLTPNCQFNNSNVFSLILENETTGEIFVSESAEKPLKELISIDKIFHTKN